MPGSVSLSKFDEIAQHSSEALGKGLFSIPGCTPELTIIGVQHLDQVGAGVRTSIYPWNEICNLLLRALCQGSDGRLVLYQEPAPLSLKNLVLARPQGVLRQIGETLRIRELLQVDRLLRDGRETEPTMQPRRGRLLTHAAQPRLLGGEHIGGRMLHFVSLWRLEG